jgi:(2Fe-2S) ferredoxin
MESDPEGYDAHLFICTHTREAGESCGARGAAELRNEVKKACAARLAAAGRRVRVNNAGCLGYCSEGIAAVLYPKGEWYFRLEAKDGEKLVEAVAREVDDSSGMG